jgi:hypothetical protein
LKISERLFGNKDAYTGANKKKELAQGTMVAPQLNPASQHPDSETSSEIHKQPTRPSSLSPFC